MSKIPDDLKRKFRISEADAYRDALRRQGAYMADKTYDSAAKFLATQARDKNKKFVLLRPSSANQDPINTGQPDELGWEGTHMIFSLTEIDPTDETRKHPVNQSRLIIGPDGITALTPHHYINAKNMPDQWFSREDNSNHYNNLSDLLKSYTKKGYEIVTVAKQEENLYAGVADFMVDTVNKNNYASFSDFVNYASSMHSGEEIKNKADAEAKDEAEDDEEPGRPFTPMAGMAGKPKQQAEPKGPPPSRGSRPHG